MVNCVKQQRRVLAEIGSVRAVGRLIAYALDRHAFGVSDLEAANVRVETLSGLQRLTIETVPTSDLQTIRSFCRQTGTMCGQSFRWRLVG